MKSCRAIVPSVLLLAASACHAPPEAKPRPPSQSGIDLFTNPAQGLSVEADLALGELLARYTAALGWTLEASPEMSKELGEQHCDLGRSVEVAPEHVHGFVESMLRSHGLFLEFAHASQPVVLRVIVPSRSSNAARELVPADEVPRWAAHPAHVIAAELRLGVVNPKNLAASLAFVFAEPDLVRIASVDDAGLLAVSGPGPEVANLVRIVAEIEHGPALPAQSPPAQGEGARLLELLHAPPTALHLESDAKAGLSIAELLQKYAGLMGWQLLVSPEVREHANAQRTGLAGPLDVPAEGVHAFVEGVLRANGFVLRFAHAADPVVLEVGSLHVSPSAPQSGLAPLVEAAELQGWAQHPAFFVQTEVHLPGLDVRSLANSLRTNPSESQALQLRPIADEHLIVVGFASELVQFMPLLRSLARPGEAVRAPAPEGLDSSAVFDLFRTPPAGLRFEESNRGELKVGDVLDQYVQLMGWHLLVDPETRNELRSLRCGAALPLEVPADRVHAFVEAIAQSNGLCFDFAHAQAPVLLEVRSRNGVTRGIPRRPARVVPQAELPRWSAHPAFLISTLLDLPGVDVRTLSNSLRQMFSDQATQQIIPLGTSSLLVTGSASGVAALTLLFHTLADSAAGIHMPLPPPVTGPSVLELLAPPAGALQLRASGEGGLRLAGLVEAYAQLMGWRILAAPETWTPLRMLACGFALPVDVPPEHVHALVEGVLRANDLTMRFAHAREPILLEIVSTNVAGRRNPKADALMVPASELPRWAAHADFLITTCIDLPGVDVRTLSNSLRQMFSDQQTQQIIPVGNTDGLILTGFGSDVAGIATMLGSLSQAAAGVHVPLPGPASADSGIGLFVPPAQGLHLERSGKDDLPLADLFGQYAQSMGWRLLAGPETWNELRRLRCTFKLPVDVPAENVHSFVEGVAREHGFVFGFAHTREPVLLRIESAGQGKGNQRGNAAPVAAAELGPWAAHPAFLISTCIDLPGIDVRTLSNSLRQILSDQQTQQIIPMGNSDGLIVTGFGPDVASLVASLAELARGSAGLQPAVVPAPPAADRDRLFPLGGESFTIAAPDGKEAAPLDVLEEFASWTKRPLEIRDEARKALAAVERHFAEPRIVPAQLAYPCVGLLLERAHCTLSPVPQAAPVRWVIDVVRGAKQVQALELPLIPFEDLGAWSAYCATPFRTLLGLPEHADFKQVESLLKIVAPGVQGCRVEFAGTRTLQLCGTPLEMQATAYAILQACAPAGPKPR
jgi:hypothetical protein